MFPVNNSHSGMRVTFWIRAVVVSIAVGGAACLAVEAERMAELMSQLGDETFSKREKATEEILALGQENAGEMEKAVAQAYRKSSDPEIRSRCKKILMQHFIETVGYLGIYYLPQEFTNKYGESQWTVGVGDIAPDSPAKTGGLVPGDVILAIDGRAIDGLAPDKDFAKRIQLVGAGKTTVLRIARAGKELDVKVTLAKRLIALTDVDTKALFEARLKDVEELPEAN